MRPPPTVSAPPPAPPRTLDPPLPVPSPRRSAIRWPQAVAAVVLQSTVPSTISPPSSSDPSWCRRPQILQSTSSPPLSPSTTPSPVVLSPCVPSPRVDMLPHPPPPGHCCTPALFPPSPPPIFPSLASPSPPSPLQPPALKTDPQRCRFEAPIPAASHPARIVLLWWTLLISKQTRTPSSSVTSDLGDIPIYSRTTPPEGMLPSNFVAYII
jgi:hypothetical protein